MTLALSNDRGHENDFIGALMHEVVVGERRLGPSCPCLRACRAPFFAPWHVFGPLVICASDLYF